MLTLRLRDYSERGADEKLGLPSAAGQTPTIDILHRVLWLMENNQGGLKEFLSKVKVDTDRMRLVARALAGPALKGSEKGIAYGPSSEKLAAEKLLAHWKTLITERESWEQTRLA
jgi:putative DNA methylase